MFSSATVPLRRSKIAIASAAPYEGEEPYSVMGRNLVDGFPKEVTLTPAEIRRCSASRSVSSLMLF